MSQLSAVILAAGQGTRLKSFLPKVLHSVCERPMIAWGLQSARDLGATPIALVVGHGADAVRRTLGEDVRYVHQSERLGTGHATLQARELLQGASEVLLVLYGDMPTLRTETLRRLVARHREAQSSQRPPVLTLLTVRSEDSMGFGRIVRDESGGVIAIVEEAAATPEILALDELNCGVYCFDSEWAWERLPDIAPTPPKNELYLTDMVALAMEDGRAVQALTIDDVSEVQGINTRVHLARSEAILRGRINEGLMLSGVTLIDPQTTYVGPDVTVGRDTVIQPNTHLHGTTRIGKDCVIGPNSIVRDSTVGDRCTILSSVVEEAIVERDVSIGPFGHLRPGAHLGPGVHMGNFGEVKNAHLGPGVKMGHFSYIGDAEVGAEANIAAGTVTCNYDGERKHRTEIGRDAFVGSGTMLVAPVRVGGGAKIGAGSVVTHDVPDGALAYGVPARVKTERGEGQG